MRKLYKEITCFLLLDLFLAIFPPEIFSQQAEQAQEFCGFKKISFQFEGRNAHVIIPDKACQDNPWVWRIYFPAWHYEVDSILLSRGFHVACIDVCNSYGIPETIRLFDRFYYHMTKTWRLASKVALEVISEGGLYAYAWAKSNPTRVACIYAESPVCDFNSWSGSKETGSPLVLEGREVKSDFASQEKIIAVKNNPADGLDGLAACKVPVLHTVSLNDSVVLPEENTFKLVNNYLRLGGAATVIPMNYHLTAGGHHFDIEKPERIANFIGNAVASGYSPIVPETYFKIRGNLNHSKTLFGSAKKGNIAFVGGSITAMYGWREKLCDYLKDFFYDVDLNILNAAIPSLGSLPHAFRFREDVAGKMIPDILFLEAAVNDQANGYTDTEQVRSMEGIVRQAKEINPAIDIVILYFADPEKITDYARGDIPKVIMNHEKVASHYNISSINLAHEVSDRISAGEFSWKYDFVDLHPSLFGQELYFASIKSYLEHEWNTGTNITVKKTNNPPLLDKYSFIHGNYYPIEKANLKRGFIYDPSFYPGDGLKVRPGFINVPMLVAESPGAELELRFNGKAIGLNIISGGDAGIIEYNVDGKPFIKVDLFTQWSRRLHLPWYILLEDELPDKEHLLRIRLTEDHNPESKGTVCRIVRFLVNDSNLNREEQNHIGYQK